MCSEETINQISDGEDIYIPEDIPLLLDGAVIEEPTMGLIDPRTLMPGIPEDVLFSELTVPLIGINRHRIGSDGNGITTLVAFHQCLLSCKMCINPKCKKEDGIWQYMTPEQLFDYVKVDDLYFSETHGGITFGGGEPLLYPEFINAFFELCKERKWRISIETSLNAPVGNLIKILPSIDEFIVDIKDMNRQIYTSYTGVGNYTVKRNLNILSCEEYRNKVVIRIPFIKGYNTESDIKRSVEQIRNMGFDRIDEFNYASPSELSRVPNSGRKICDFLKQIRQQAAAKNNILYTPTDCSYEGECIGTCPKCEKELEFLTNHIKA